MDAERGAGGQLIAAVIRAGAVLRVELDRRLLAAGITSVELEVLRLVRADDALPAAALARSLGIRRQSLRPVLGRLVAAGLLDLRRSREDRRLGAYSLTEDGRRRLALGRSAVEEIERLVLSALADRPAAELAELVNRGVRAALREAPAQTVFSAML